MEQNLPQIDLTDTKIENEEEVFQKALTRSVGIAQNALQFATPKFQERQFFWNMYHSYDSLLKEKAWWQTKFAHPFPFFTTEMKISFCEEGIFGTSGKELFEVKPWTSLTARAAEKLTRLLQYQQSHSHMHKEFYLGAKSFFVTGDWFIENYWDTEELYFQERDRYLIELDAITETPVYKKQPPTQGKIITRNQPNIMTLNPNSIWLDPKATSFEDCRYYCMRKEYTFSQMKEMEKKGLFINVDQLKGTTPPKLPTTYYDTEPYSPMVKSGNTQRDTRRSPIDSEDPIIEVIYTIYPATGEWEAIGNRRVYLGKIIKYRSLKNPITHIKNFEEKDKSYGNSDYLPVANHWRLINQYQCLEADNVLFHHRGYTLVARDAGPNVQEGFENLRPGSLIITNNLGAVKHERPDLFSPLVLQSKQDLINQALQPMGMNEILQGATPSSNVRSSEQFNQLANFGAKLLSQSIRTIAEGLEDVGEKWLALNYEFLDPDFVLPISDDGKGLMEEDLRFGRNDLAPWAPVEVKLSSDLEAQKTVKVQQMMQLLNLSSQVPGFAAPTAIKDLWKYEAGAENPDKYFLLSDQEVAAIMLQQFQPQGQALGGPAQNPQAAGASRPPAPNQVAQGNGNAGAAVVPSP